MHPAALFFGWHGRVNRGDFWYASLVDLSAFVTLFIALGWAFGSAATWFLLPPLLWSWFTLGLRRYHDIGRSGWWLLLLVIPIIGPLWVFYSLGFRKGQTVENRYGPVPFTETSDYFAVEEPIATRDTIVNDVTRMNPVRVKRIVRPRTIEEVREAITGSTGPISIGGGHFSMGGQTACEDSLHLDMRGLNQIVLFQPSERVIRVRAGARWCDVQRFVDPHGLSVKIMQTYANLTVGGSLSVNSHGRYVGLGPLVLSVRSITIVLSSGEIVTASRSQHPEIFFGAIGGYGALGVIVEAELDLAENTRVTGICRTIPASGYPQFFRETVRDDGQAVFHNGDLYPPHYQRVRSMTWVTTTDPVTQTNRLMPMKSSFPIERYFFWAISETPTGKWRREHLVDPLLFFRQKVHWRNYEAGYDVAELEPHSRGKKTYVLQEYFVPVARFTEFVPVMGEILRRHKVNMINVSIRHAFADPGTLLAWAREEVFAFVMYYKQGVTAADREKVGVWTRELVDAAIAAGGTYYLPYQPHATVDQFHKAYPRASELFALKRRLDPDFRFRNSLWNKYYAPTLESSGATPS